MEKRLSAVRGIPLERKKPAKRPPIGTAHWNTKYRPEFCARALELCAAGATDLELAIAFYFI